MLTGNKYLSALYGLLQVASAGDEFDHVTAVDILSTIKSANGFTVVIILKPFSFEGQRRQDEVLCAWVL